MAGMRAVLLFAMGSIRSPMEQLRMSSKAISTLRFNRSGFSVTSRYTWLEDSWTPRAASKGPKADVECMPA